MGGPWLGDWWWDIGRESEACTESSSFLLPLLKSLAFWLRLIVVSVLHGLIVPAAPDMDHG